MLRAGLIAGSVILFGGVAGGGFGLYHAKHAGAVAAKAPLSSVEALEAAAKKGDNAAMGKLGAIYLAGKGNVAADPVKAWQYLDHAAAAGDVPATYLLGRALVTGDGLSKNPAAGIDLLARAAAANSDAAMYVLGGVYLTGTGNVPADPARARTYLERAVAAGNSYAMARMGRALVKGEGLPQDGAAGMALLERASAAGNSGAMDTLGEAYLSGASGVAADPAKARRALDMAIAKGNSAAAVRLARALLKGDALDADRPAGMALLEKAAADGNPQAQRALWDVRKDEIAESARGAGQLDAYRSLSKAVAEIPADYRPGILRKVYWVNRNAAVYLVQERLTGVHFYSGPLDGSPGPATIEAISDACGHANSGGDCSRPSLSPPTLDWIDKNF